MGYFLYFVTTESCSIQLGACTLYLTVALWQLLRGRIVQWNGKCIYNFVMHCQMFFHRYYQHRNCVSQLVHRIVLKLLAFDRKMAEKRWLCVVWFYISLWWSRDICISRSVNFFINLAYFSVGCLVFYFPVFKRSSSCSRDLKTLW